MGTTFIRSNKRINESRNINRNWNIKRILDKAIGKDNYKESRRYPGEYQFFVRDGTRITLAYSSEGTILFIPEGLPNNARKHDSLFDDKLGRIVDTPSNNLDYVHSLASERDWIKAIKDLYKSRIK